MGSVGWTGSVAPRPDSDDLAAFLPGKKNRFGYAINGRDGSGGAGGKIDQDRSVCCLKESQASEQV